MTAELPVSNNMSRYSDGNTSVQKLLENPKMSHKKAIKKIMRYLKTSRDKKLILNVDKTKGIECYMNADYAGGYNKKDLLNPRHCLSRTRYAIKYPNYPIIWTSKLQSTMVL